jgi:hypothetical protein
MAAFNFLGGQWRHTDGMHQTPHRCTHLDRGNIGVEVRQGQIVAARCLACGNSDFVVVVEGKDEFWPVPRSQVIFGG